MDDPLGFSMMEDRRRLTEDLIQVRLMLEPQLAALAARMLPKRIYRNWNRSKRSWKI